jgi:hypothetical protein
LLVRSGYISHERCFPKPLRSAPPRSRGISRLTTSAFHATGSQRRLRPGAKVTNPFGSRTVRSLMSLYARRSSETHFLLVPLPRAIRSVRSALIFSGDASSPCVMELMIPIMRSKYNWCSSSSKSSKYCCMPGIFFIIFWSFPRQVNFCSVFRYSRSVNLVMTID